MSLWILLRLIKFLALAALAASTAGAVGARSAADRARLAFWGVTPSLWVVWLAGFLLLKAGGRTLAAPFVVVGVLASLTGLHGALLSARARPRFVSRALGLVGLLVATAAMVTRDAGTAGMAVAALVAAGLAVGGAAVAPAPDGHADPDEADRTRRWFVAVARAEGASLLLMMGIAMPFRAVTGQSLDHGTGAIGWAHGGLVLIYLQALQITARALGWSWGTVGAAALSAMIPGGTFVFEAWSRRAGAATAG